MLSPRWRKLLGDLRLAPGRVAMMVIAIAVSIFGVTTMLSANTILTREMTRNYSGTHPAAATLELDRVDDALLAAVRQRPGIAEAEARATLHARVRLGSGQWYALLLFVVPDFDAMRLNRFNAQSGAWPPPTGTMLVDRLALPLMNARLGDDLLVKTPNAGAQPVRISGVVQDPGLAPAWQEQSGYGYITPATLASLGEHETLNELRVTISAPAQNAAAIDAVTQELAIWLRALGRTVHEIRIPPPGQHPHQNQMTTLLLLLLVFSGLALVLSGVLVAALVSGMLAQQVRQIGVMKAIGAGSGQIATLYLVMIAVLSALALMIALPAGVAAGRGFAGIVTELLNLTLYDKSLPAWVYVALAAVGLLAPLAVALRPVRRGTRITVREAIADYGVKLEAPASRGLIGLVSRWRGLDRASLLALRNAFRRPGRLVLTLGLLAAGGAMFMTALNVATGWQRTLETGLAQRHYDLEIRLAEPQPVAALLARVRAIPGVKQVEAWGYAPTTVAQPGRVDVARTYPDGGHGSFSLRGMPAGSALISFPVEAGRWLRPDDGNAVMLNPAARALLPGVQVGDSISLSVEGRPVDWQVVGLVREVGSPAAAYVTDRALAAALGTPGRAGALRVVMADADPAARYRVGQRIESALNDAAIGLSEVIADSELRSAIGDHIVVLIGSLIFMAVLMAVVGILGLASAMGSNVAERTREFGVMRSVGGTPATVLRIVVTEGVFIGALSWLIALALSVPLTALVSAVVGELIFRLPLELVLSPAGLLIWLTVVVLGSAAASAQPASRAARLTVRETLAYA